MTACIFLVKGVVKLEAKASWGLDKHHKIKLSDIVFFIAIFVNRHLAFYAVNLIGFQYLQKIGNHSKSLLVFLVGTISDICECASCQYISENIVVNLAKSYLMGAICRVAEFFRLAFVIESPAREIVNGFGSAIYLLHYVLQSSVTTTNGKGIVPLQIKGHIAGEVY